ncbi:hypothetical protein D3C81_2320640 [compost metagenome]
MTHLCIRDCRNGHLVWATEKQIGFECLTWLEGAHLPKDSVQAAIDFAVTVGPT